jgi:hypothetical protein
LNLIIVEGGWLRPAAFHLSEQRVGISRKRVPFSAKFKLESLILAQNERWRRA